MEQSLAIIILSGLITYYLFTKIKLPGLMGLLLLGIVLGPFGLNLIDQNLLDIAKDLRSIALIIILLKAGLGIDRKKLQKVGVAAFNMSWVPGLFEGFTIAFVSMWLLDFSFTDGGMLGFIIAAVSPAIVVPSMLRLMEEKRGTNKGIPTLILTGASVDDVFAITMFNTFLTLGIGKHLNLGLTILEVPLSILFGIILGLISGIILMAIFNKYHIRDTKKILIILSVAILLHMIQEEMKQFFPIAALIGVMALGVVIVEKKPVLSERLSFSLGKIWVFAEILLFVLVGTEVNVKTVSDVGLTGIVVVLLGLVGRAVGVFVATSTAKLAFKERLFCALSYVPKATVQAATGSIPLAVGVANGDVMLAVAVISILFTAPLGALGINLSYKKLLKVDENEEIIENKAKENIEVNNGNLNKLGYKS